MEAEEIKPGVFVGSGTIIDPGATINAPCLIGKNCQIEKRAVVDSFCIIGNNNVLEEDVSLKRSVVWDGNYIERGSQIRGLYCATTPISSTMSMCMKMQW